MRNGSCGDPRDGLPRFVFVSAIVPNIEEVNTWLGSTPDSVVRSEYRPAMAEFAVLRPSELGASRQLDLEMHSQEPPPIRFRIERFMRRSDFQGINQAGHPKTYCLTSIKTRAIAAARKSLPMGAAVVCAANKRGNQGGIGLAQELLNQLEHMLQLPEPLAFSNREAINITKDYLEHE